LHKNVKGGLNPEIAATFEHKNIAPERLRRLTYFAS
jgi:hypothetical protein